MDPLIGEIALFPFDYAPLSWMTCEGQLVAIGNYQALFQLIGTTFGGNGTSTFALPDLRPSLPMREMGMRYCIAVQGIYPSTP